MRALDPHTRRPPLSSGVEAAHSAKNLTIVMVKMSMIVMVKMSMSVMVKMSMIVMVKMSMITAMMRMFVMDTFEFLAALLQMHWADSKL